MTDSTIPGCWTVILDPLITDKEFNNHLKFVCDAQNAHHPTPTRPSGTPTAPGSVTSAVPNPDPSIIRHVFHVLTFRGYSGAFDDEVVTTIRSLRFVQEVSPVHIASREVVVPQVHINCWGLGAISHMAGPNQNYLFEQDAPIGGDIFVYVVDDPVMAAHVEFLDPANVSRVIHEENILGLVRAPPVVANDLNAHGTHVAGIVAGNTCGVARFAQIISVMIFHPNAVTGDDDIFAAMNWIINDALDRTTLNRCIVNMSLSTPFNLALNAFVNEASAAGLLFIAAAGNQNQLAPRSPASAANAISVASAMIAPPAPGQPPMARQPNSNFGPDVNIFAPGDEIRSSWNDGGFRNETGTSMAAPFVAGVAAYLIAHNPNLITPALLMAHILNTAMPGLIRNPLLGTPDRFLYNGSGG